jgi:hypothetical protein
MIDVEHHEQELLRRARRVLAPSSADAERVRGRVAAHLALAPLPHVSGKNAGTASTAGARLLPVVAVAVGLAAAGGVGYRLGFEAGRARSEPSATPASIGVSPRVEPAPVAVTREPPVVTTPAPAQAPSKGVAAAATPAASHSRADSSLSDEARVLARVERALRDENPRFALGLLGELERTTPGGQLVEERQAARVLAQCQLRTENASQRAREFLARYPASAYRSRVRQLCSEEAER